MYKANKPCRFGGKQFFIGDEIPAELIDENRAKTLVKYGTIAAAAETPSEPLREEAGTNINGDAENGSQGDKQAFNEVKATSSRQTSKKGGK